MKFQRAGNCDNEQKSLFANMRDENLVPITPASL